MTGQIPALALVQLRGESRHVGALDAQADAVVQVVEAQPRHARRVLHVRRRRLEADSRRAVADPLLAVADAAVLGEQRRPARRIGGDPRGQADPVGRHQIGGQLAGLAGHQRPVAALGDALAEARHALLQLGLAGLRRQRGDQPEQDAVELQLLLIFTAVDHLAIGHGGRIVGTEIAQQVQGLRRALGLGAGDQAAQHQHGQQQPAQKSFGDKHEWIPNENEWHLWCASQGNHSSRTLTNACDALPPRPFRPACDGSAPADRPPPRTGWRRCG
ncbi:hypothetical protein D3C78_1054640 [compost metagenome]